MFGCRPDAIAKLRAKAIDVRRSRASGARSQLQGHVRPHAGHTPPLPTGFSQHQTGPSSGSIASPACRNPTFSSTRQDASSFRRVGLEHEPLQHEPGHHDIESIAPNRRSRLVSSLISAGVSETSHERSGNRRPSLRPTPMPFRSSAGAPTRQVHTGRRRSRHRSGARSRRAQRG